MPKSAAGEFFWISDLKYYDFLYKICRKYRISPKIPYKFSEYIWIFWSRLKISPIYNMEIPYMKPVIEKIGSGGWYWADLFNPAHAWHYWADSGSK